MLAKKLTKYQILFLKKSKRDLKSKMDINREDIVLPRKNCSIKGHKENINFFINSFLNNSLHHAYIFSGNKGIGKAVRYTGIGSLDTLFGFFFGFVRAYIISTCIFSGVHIVYNYDKWPININKSYVFPYLEKGSNYLLKEFPDEKTYQDSKEKIEEL